MRNAGQMTIGKTGGASLLNIVDLSSALFTKTLNIQYDSYNMSHTKFSTRRGRQRYQYVLVYNLYNINIILASVDE